MADVIVVLTEKRKRAVRVDGTLLLGPDGEVLTWGHTTPAGADLSLVVTALDRFDTLRVVGAG